MALTRITGTVIEDNAITTDKISNAAITGAMIAAGAISADKLSANVGTAGPTSDEIVRVNANLTANVNSVKANVDAAEANIAGILDGTTFTGEVIMSDDLIVTGNLIVNGDTTTANSINMVVQDRMLMFANSATGPPDADVGVRLNLSLIHITAPTRQGMI